MVSEWSDAFVGGGLSLFYVEGIGWGPQVSVGRSVGGCLVGAFAVFFCVLLVSESIKQPSVASLLVTHLKPAL